MLRSNMVIEFRLGVKGRSAMGAGISRWRWRFRTGLNVEVPVGKVSIVARVCPSARHWISHFILAPLCNGNNLNIIPRIASLEKNCFSTDISPLLVFQYKDLVAP